MHDYKIIYMENGKQNETVIEAFNEGEAFRKFRNSRGKFSPDFFILDIQSNTDIEKQRLFNEYKSKYIYLYETENQRYEQRLTELSRLDEMTKSEIRSKQQAIEAAENTHRDNLRAIDDKINCFVLYHGYPTSTDSMEAEELIEKGQSVIALIDITDRKNNLHDVKRITIHQKEKILQ